MGLFSFIKSAGSKLFGGKKEEETKVELTRQQADALAEYMLTLREKR